MSHTTDESEDGIFSKNQSGLSLTDEGNSGENLGRGIVLKKGPWTSAEDAILVDYVKKHGEGNWNAAQKHSGLFRCGKSCRLRWANHLRPNLKKGSFTADEECLIIELHAKMGNKWARMAAHLPGRTDNEIKNYWNTRIKRRQRAGLPLYPPEVCLQAFQENQSQNTGEINSGDKRHHGLLQTNSYEIPDVVFNGLNADQGLLPFVPELPIISSSSLLMEGLGSSQYCSFMPSTMHRQKRFRESMHLFSSYDGDGLSQFGQIQDDPCNQIERSFGSSFPYDPDPTTKYHLDFGAIQGSHSLINGNFSASKPTSGVVKSELPSFQYPETDLGSWGTSSLPPPLLESVDAFIQSPPPTGAVKSESPSPRNSGLLDALLHQAKTLGNAKNHSSRKSSDSSSVTPCDLAESSTLNLCETEWEDYGESISHFGNSASATSIFSECTLISGGGSSLDEHTPAEAFPGCSVKSEPVGQVWTSDGEKEISTRFSRHEALLGSDWLEQSAGCGKEQTVMTDAITMLLGSDYGSNYKHRGSGTSTLSQGQGWGLGSCAWHNMPAACQMFELP